MRGQPVIEFTQKLFVQARGNAVESYVRLGSLPPGRHPEILHLLKPPCAWAAFFDGRALLKADAEDADGAGL